MIMSSPYLVLLATALVPAKGMSPTRVHMVAHTHDDPGWLKTADQYFDSEVKTILTKTVAALLANESRVFHYVEMLYFKRWWDLQTASLRRDVSTLVREGRLVFLTGGLCMNDEAATHHRGIIDQMTWGHRWLNATFGEHALPNVSWQIDPYGHSAGYAGLGASGLGFEYFVGQKIDYQVHAERAAARSLEFEWRPSRRNGSSSLVAHVLYANVAGYNWMFHEPVVDDPTSPDYNVDNASASLAASVAKRQSEYAHPSDVLFLYGTDFGFQDSPLPFENLEKVMRYINHRPHAFGLQVMYSSPAAYFKNILRGDGAATTNTRGRDVSKPTWLPTYDSDLFPGSFAPHYVRSGYYSSRPAEKAADRRLGSELHTARFLRAITATKLPSRAASFDGAIGMATAALGLHQHHDAITGTDYAAVADDYAARMARARTRLLAESAAAAGVAAGLPPSSSRAMAACEQANVSICSATQPLAAGEPVYLLVFNPIASMGHAGASLAAVVEVPVPTPRVSAMDARSGRRFQSEAHRAFLRDAHHGMPYTLFVRLAYDDLPALDLATLLLAPNASASAITPKVLPRNTVVQLGSADTPNVWVNTTSGQLTGPLTSETAFYTPKMGHHGSQIFHDPCASAYVFRPVEKEPSRFGDPPHVLASLGSLVQQTYAPVDAASGVELVVRVTAGMGDASVSLLTAYGPLAPADGAGSEAVLRVARRGLRSEGVFWTDANGLQLMQRKRRENATGVNYTVFEPIAQNMFPATSMAVIRDAHGAGGLSLNFDASHAASSPTDGTLELLMHRRLLDHGCREDEGYELNDTMRVVSRTIVSARPDKQLARAYRGSDLLLLHPPQLFLAPAPSPMQTQPMVRDALSRARNKHGAVAATNLPLNVHLHTLESIQNGAGEDSAQAAIPLICDPFEDPKLCVTPSEKEERPQVAATTFVQLLVRLQHLYDVDEDPDGLSLPATVDVAQLLLPHGWRVARIDETSLSASRVIETGLNPMVTLMPMQIRTFIVHADLAMEMPVDNL